MAKLGDKIIVAGKCHECGIKVFIEIIPIHTNGDVDDKVSQYLGCQFVDPNEDCPVCKGRMDMDDTQLDEI